MNTRQAVEQAVGSGAVVTLVGVNRINIRSARNVPKPTLEYMKSHKEELIEYLRHAGSMPECLDTAAHINPGLWKRREGRAYCHVCGRFMGFLARK